MRPLRKLRPAPTPKAATRVLRIREGERGQILPLFVFSLVVVLALAALLFDGANTLVMRRKMQNTGDAAALAGSNVIKATGSIGTCSASPGGSPRQDVRDAVLASIAANWPGFPVGSTTISCPTAWGDQAVKVDLGMASTTYFIGAIGGSAPIVATTSTAVNGQVTGTNYSIVLLDPANPSWPNARRGCPAFLVSGGPTINFDGSVYVNSACSSGSGGAIGTNGNSASINFASGKKFYLVGGYNPGPLTITPAPVLGVTPLADPLAFLPPVPWATMPVQSTSKLILNNTTQVLQPGVYQKGLQLKNHSVALLRPGIYVFDGGGLDVGAQASLCSITATSTATDCSTYSSECTDANCGVLLFNRGAASGVSAMGSISFGAGATVKLRAYDDRANGGAYSDYRNMLIWQDATPTVSSSYEQPVIAFTGGGTADLSGTIYAPGARVDMGGSGGGGGGVLDLTMQFIVWDITMNGNVTFHYVFNEADFVRPTDYGLVE